MARVYMITEAEMQGLLDQLELKAAIDKGHYFNGDDRWERYGKLSLEEKNRLDSVHRSFHMICVRWAQEMGFKGYRQ